MKNGVMDKIAKQWLQTWSLKRTFTDKEKDLIMEFAGFVDKLMEGEDEQET